MHHHSIFAINHYLPVKLSQLHTLVYIRIISVSPFQDLIFSLNRFLGNPFLESRILPSKFWSISTSFFEKILSPQSFAFDTIQVKEMSEVHAFYNHRQHQYPSRRTNLFQGLVIFNFFIPNFG